MSGDHYPFHQRSEADVSVDARSLFAHLDAHRRLSAHMEKRSLMMAGATMRIEMDALQGQAVGSVIHIAGRVLGLHLAVAEVVTERVPPLRKTWETLGEPRLLVIGAYRMGFTIAPQGACSRLAVFIEYRLPLNGFARVLATIFGRAYAKWCTRRMAADAVAAMVPAASS